MLTTALLILACLLFALAQGRLEPLSRSGGDTPAYSSPSGVRRVICGAWPSL
jgi:hypothetical protein